jgi:hypothetical protein
VGEDREREGSDGWGGQLVESGSPVVTINREVVHRGNKVG